MRFPIAIIAALAAAPALAEDAPQRFGDWLALCQQDGGCALAATASDGARLAFSEPASGEDVMVFTPVAPVLDGSVVTVTLAGYPGASLGPGDGWRVIDMGGSSATQIAPSIAINELMPRMGQAGSIEIVYRDDTRAERRMTVSLDGYAQARAFVDGVAERNQ